MQKVGVRCVGRSDLHNSIITSFLYYFLHLLCFFSSLLLKALLLKSFFKTLLRFYSLTSLALDLHCPMLSLISLKVLALRLALSQILFKVSVLRLADKQQQPHLKTALA
jgi:hypothetical protein